MKLSTLILYVTGFLTGQDATSIIVLSLSLSLSLSLPLSLSLSPTHTHTHTHTYPLMSSLKRSNMPTYSKIVNYCFSLKITGCCVMIMICFPSFLLFSLSSLVCVRNAKCNADRQLPVRQQQFSRGTLKPLPLSGITRT